jgi:aminopeptidase
MNLNLPKLEAQLIINYSVSVQKNEKVLIWGSTECLPLIKELYREVIRCGGHPIVYTDIPGLKYILLNDGNEETISFYNPLEEFLIKDVDVAIRIRAESNLKELQNMPPQKLGWLHTANREFLQTFFTRQATGELKWIIAPYLSNASAQAAGMSYEEYAVLIEQALFLDKPDPVKEWEKMSQRQQKFCDYLDSVDKVEIIGPKTKLSMSVKGRKWINFDGKKDLPDGEIFTGPIEDSVEGTIFFNYESNGISDITLTLEKGKVIEASATKGEARLLETLKLSGADRVGEFGIGTNYGLTRYMNNILFDEKIGGTIHLALGNSYPDSGGTNQSDLHWDILKDMRIGGKILADGKLIYENGHFLI